MKHSKFFVWLNIVTFVITLGINFLATNLPLNNITTREISDSFDIFFVPAGYVFAIWGVIYLGLLGFLVYQALPSQHGNTRIGRIGWWFAVSNLANAAWLVSFHYLQFALALVFMLILLASLLVIFLRLQIGKQKPDSTMESWLVDVPFGTYLGWITVATIANVTQVLYAHKWNGFGIAPQLWAVIMLGAAVIISALMSFSRRNLPHSLVLIWAFIGIAVKFPAEPTVSYSAWAAAGLVAVFWLASRLLKK